MGISFRGKIIRADWNLKRLRPIEAIKGASKVLYDRPCVTSGATRMSRLLRSLTVVLVASCSADAAELPANDYPTIARADYVFGCMQVNGQTREALEKCSCSIDVIASLLAFEHYEEAETVMRVRQRGGRNASMFLSMPMLRHKVDELKRAQIEAELRCF
jgi:hypothetical protein